MSWLESDKPWQNNAFNGDWISLGSDAISVTEPGNGDELAKVSNASKDDVLTAATSAAAAQKEWQKVSPTEKADIFLKAANYLQENFEDISVIVARETGGIIPKGQHEVKSVITLLKLAASTAMQPKGLQLASLHDTESYARRVPHGVVGIISPFNFPMILSSRSVAPALATGNAVVSKPDPQTPLSGGLILAQALEHAGLPKGVYQVMPGGIEAGQAICEAPEIGLVCFTGSTAAGRKVGEACGRNLKKVSLELGGKSSTIVLEDADLDVAASNIAWGCYMHQGQICMASGRILVHEKIADALKEKLIEKAKTLPMGDPATGKVAIGPLINTNQVAKVSAIVDDSISQGAVLEAGGVADGTFYSPTVLSNVKPGMRSFEEEIFGPVINISTFETDEQAISLANHGEYGLAGAVISNNLSRAHAIGESLHVGLLHINDQTVNDECVNPFGGCGNSGNGSAICGPADIEVYTHWQWVTVKRTAQMKPF